MSKKTAMQKKPATVSLTSRIRKHLSLERVIVGGSILVSVIVVGGLVLNSLSKQPPPIDYSLPDLSENITVQGAEHVNRGETHPSYNSNPPTSGWHYERPATVGVYREVLSDEALVHNLEHGEIWISYRDADDEETIRQLEDIVSRYTGGVILTYRPQNDAPIAVAAWGRLLTMDTVDSGQIHNFIARYRYKGPENTLF